MMCTSCHMSCHIRKLLIPETIPVYQSRVSIISRTSDPPFIFECI